MKLTVMKELRTEIITKVACWKGRLGLGDTVTVDKVDQHKPPYIVQF